MYLCVDGFLLDSTEDDSLQFELEITRSLTEEIVKLLGHRSINAMAAGQWRLSDEQITQLSSIIGHSLPTDLKLFIGVEA